jgi:L-ascorbate metabolism protein UlaG (beta-lactamase superfamily)
MMEKKQWYKEGRDLLDEMEKFKGKAGRAGVWFMGQHGFSVKMNGSIFYIDVILNDFIDREGKSRRLFPPPFAPEDAGHVDFYFITHNHSDHLNLKTVVPLAKASPETRFVVPRPWVSVLTGAGIEEGRVIGAAAGEKITLEGGLGITEVYPVEAVHTRFIQDQGERDEIGDLTCLGYVIKGGGISVYHSGDTWACPGLPQMLQKLGPLDLAFLPINGSDWERTEANCIGNMNALDAVKLAAAVPIDLVMPSHYNLFANNTENPALFADYMYRFHTEKRFHISALGEKFIYESDKIYL